MRHLNDANILMTDECLAVQSKFMEVGPNRASLLHIGWEAMQSSKQYESMKTRDEIKAGELCPLFTCHFTVLFTLMLQSRHSCTPSETSEATTRSS